MPEGNIISDEVKEQILYEPSPHSVVSIENPYRKMMNEDYNISKVTINLVRLLRRLLTTTILENTALRELETKYFDVGYKSYQRPIKIILLIAKLFPTEMVTLDETNREIKELDASTNLYLFSSPSRVVSQLMKIFVCILSDEYLTMDTIKVILSFFSGLIKLVENKEIVNEETTEKIQMVKHEIEGMVMDYLALKDSVVYPGTKRGVRGISINPLQFFSRDRDSTSISFSAPVPPLRTLARPTRRGAGEQTINRKTRRKKSKTRRKKNKKAKKTKRKKNKKS